MAIPIGVAVAVVVVCLLGAGWFAARRRHGGTKRALVAAVAWAGRAWHEPERLWPGPRPSARRAARTVPADVVPADRRPFRGTPRDHLNAIRRDIASGGADTVPGTSTSTNAGTGSGTGTSAEAFATLAAGGDVLSARLLASFAAQRGHGLASERSSLFSLASRFTDTAGEIFFAELAGTHRRAADMLRGFAESLGARETELRAREPLAGCQAYPAYIAWLAQHASAEDAALALAVSLGRWGEDFRSLAAAVRKHPSFPAVGPAERASAFFDVFDVPGGHLEDQALAVVQEAQDAGRRPVHALRYARLLHGYQAMFWQTLAETAGPQSPMPGYTAPHG